MNYNEKKNALICAFALFCATIMVATALVCMTTYNTTSVISYYTEEDDIGMKESTGECYDDDQVNGDKFWYGDLQYKVWTDKDGKDHVQVHDYKKGCRDIYVPDTIEHKGKTYTVNEIYKWGLSTKNPFGKHPHTVSFGPGIERINAHAVDCGGAFGDKTRGITFRDIEHSKLTIINCEAFCNARDVKYLEIPSSVIEIGNAAFSSCTDTNFKFHPANPCDIDEAAFSSCFGEMDIDFKNVKYLGKESFSCNHTFKALDLSSVNVLKSCVFRSVGNDGGDPLQRLIFSKDLVSIEKNTFGWNIVFKDANGNDITSWWENPDSLRGKEFVRGADGFMHEVVHDA